VTGLPTLLATGAEGALTLLKYEGLGNDFLVALGPASGERDGGVSADLAVRACDRHHGIGADGLLLATLAPAGASYDLGFTLWNADGSQAEMSGNGLRCLVHAAIDTGLVKAGPAQVVTALTPAGERAVTVRSLSGGTMWASTDMGRPEVLGPAARCNVGQGQVLVDVGNPHLVVLGPDPATVDVAGLGPALSASVGQATGGLNVEFVAIGPGPDELTVRVWERGVGETLACGTGAVASAAAAHHWGRVGERVTVNQPGGAAEVELRPDGTAVLSGPSRRVALCYWEAA
jgi:diaminopimelate epimerase